MPISNSNTAGGAIQGQPQTQQNQPVAKPRQLGSGFTNLQKVIGANKGNQLGNAVSSGIGNRVGQIKNDLGTARQKFQTDLQGNRVDTEENKSFVNTALNDPYASSQDSNNVSKFQSLLKGDYSGPQGLGNADAINAQAQEAAQYGNSATSAAGRNTLLQRYAGGNKYSQGQQRLDGLLLGQTGANQLKQVRREASGLGNEISGATTLAQAQAQAAAAANKGFASDINNQLGTYDDLTTDENEAKGIYGGIQTDLQARTKAFQDAQKAKYDSLSSAVANNTYDNNALASMGLEDGQRLYNAKLDQYINSYDPSTANIQNIATSDDYNKYMALNKLAGRENSLLADRTLAGTAQTYQDPDKALVKQAIDNAKTQYDDLTTTQYNNVLASSGDIKDPNGNLGRVEVGNGWALANAARTGLAQEGDLKNPYNSYGQKWDADKFVRYLNDPSTSSFGFNDPGVQYGPAVSTLTNSSYDKMLKDWYDQYTAAQNTVNSTNAKGKNDYVPDNLPGGGKSMKG